MTNIIIYLNEVLLKFNCVYDICTTCFFIVQSRFNTYCSDTISPLEGAKT